MLIANALGIEAASFASGVGNGSGERGIGNWELGAGRNEASKDIAESPAACRTPKEGVVARG